jgi:adenylate kinase
MAKKKAPKKAKTRAKKSNRSAKRPSTKQKRKTAKPVAKRAAKKPAKKIAAKKRTPVKAARKPIAKAKKPTLKPAPKRPLPKPTKIVQAPAAPVVAPKPVAPEHHARESGQAPTPPGKNLVLVFLGPPGVGKGTQAARLASELGLPHISTGDLFRDHMKRDTPLGLRAKEFVNSGQLVPDDITVGLVEDRVKSGDCAKGFILDGFPRTVGQDERLVNVLAKKRQPVTAAIYFSAPQAVIIERISGRRTCKSCGAISHATFGPTRVNGRCDVCDGPTHQREDDNEDKVQKRLQEYHANTGPLIERYRQLNLLHEIDAVRSVDEVYSALSSFVTRL